MSLLLPHTGRPRDQVEVGGALPSTDLAMDRKRLKKVRNDMIKGVTFGDEMVADGERAREKVRVNGLHAAEEMGPPGSSSL